MKFLDLLFPPKCISCRAFLRKERGSLCSVCQEIWPSLDEPHCTLCLMPFEADPQENHLCGNCLLSKRSFSRLMAAGYYLGVLHDLIMRFKYGKEERLAKFLGERLGEAIFMRQEELQIDAIVPLPLHRQRLRERGFNQSLWVAREIGEILKIPVDPFNLCKLRETPVQAGLKAEERRKNLKGVFGIREPEKIVGKRILLVDDVFTTGATMEEAAKTLRKAESKEIVACVIARAVLGN